MSGSSVTAARCPTTSDRLLPATATTRPLTGTVVRSERCTTCPTATLWTTITTGVFAPAVEYKYPPIAASPTISASASAIMPVCR